MRLFCGLILIIALVLPSSVAARPAHVSGMELQALLANSARELNAPGIAAYLSWSPESTWQGATGVAEISSQRPLRADDRFRIASVTKSFVAVVALQLVEAGWLSLDQNLEQWLPGLVPGGERINLRMLLNHTSGLPEYMVGGFMRQVRENPARVWRPEELVAAALQRPRSFAPGARGRWSYSNTNYILVGMIIEQATKNRLEAEIAQRITTPLGLSQTRFAANEIGADEVAHGYVGERDYTAINMSFAWAAGGMISTVGELGRFTRALHQGELLGATGMALLGEFVGTANHFGIADLRYSYGTMERGLPIGEARGAPRARALGHTGGLAGYRTVIWYFPERDLVLVVAINRYEIDPNRIVSRILALL